MRKIVLHIGKALYHMGRAFIGLSHRLIAWAEQMPKEDADDGERKE